MTAAAAARVRSGEWNSHSASVTSLAQRSAAGALIPEWTLRFRRCRLDRLAGQVGMGSEHQEAYVPEMVTMDFQQQDIPRRHPETDAERRGRIDREDAIIAKAEADIDAGLGIEDEKVEAWLGLLDHDPDAPLPSRG